MLSPSEASERRDQVTQETTSTTRSLVEMASVWTRMGRFDMDRMSSVPSSATDRMRIGSPRMNRRDVSEYSHESPRAVQHNTPSRAVYSPVDLTTSDSFPFGDEPWNSSFDEVDDMDEISQSIIHDQARVGNWSKVLQLCKTHPQYASYTCPEHSLTALHFACSRRCPNPSVFDILIQAYPEALIQEDCTKGWMPLHYAARFKASVEAIHLLLHAHPHLGTIAARRRCKALGRLPLFYAIRYEAPEGVVQLLLDFVQGVDDILEKDREGTSILGLVWDRWALRDGKRVLSPIIHSFDSVIQRFKSTGLPKKQQTTHIEIDVDSGTLDHHKDVYHASTSTTPYAIPDAMKETWNMVNLILKGAFHFPTKHSHEHRKWRILHAVASINCHPTLFMAACVLFPYQAQEIDENDLFGAHPISDSHNTCLSAQSMRFSPDSKKTALHLAASVHSHGNKTILTLLSLFPTAASFVNPADGSLPLHYLCTNRGKSNWIHDGFQDIYKAHPNAAFLPNRYGQTPLHLAALTSGYRSSSIILLHDTINTMRMESGNQDAHHSLPQVPMVTDQRSSPLQHPTIEAAGSVLQNLIEIHPQASSLVDHYGMLPFHYLAENAESWTVDADVLLLSYPRALHVRSGPMNQHRLPLHIAAWNQHASPGLIHALLHHHPRAAMQVDGAGLLPLHLACMTGKEWECGVEAIYLANRNGISTRQVSRANQSVNVSGCGLPIHFVCSSKSSSRELLVKLVELRPDLASERDSMGETPLHLAVGSGKEWADGIDVLISAYPEALDVKDLEGKVPFVSAALQHCCTAELKKEDGLDTSKRKSNGVDILFRLLQAAPHVLYH